MQRRSLFLVLSVIATVMAGSTLGSPAEAQVKPYFLVIVDTSGSMSWCNGGQNDGSCLINNTAFGTGPVPADSAFDPLPNGRCPGFPSNRIGGAKCALQRIIDGVGGDASFALMQFEHNCSGSCTNNVVDGAGSACTTPSSFDDGQLLVGFGGNTREWVDGTCTGSCSNNWTRELTTGGWTPIGRSLQRANEWLRGTPQAGFLYPTNPAGFNAAPSAPLANDPFLACRPVSVVLLTDGDDTCSGTPPAAAAALFGSGNINGEYPATKAFRTYVIGFGSGGDFNPGILNATAMAGGTDAPGPEFYFPAANEAELSTALNQIVADAQPPVEVCNNADDDCDMKIDEGIPKYCNKPNGISALELCDEPNETLCDGMDDDCDGINDEGLTNVCGSCGEVPKEVCDGADNDCDTRIDEGASTLEKCGSDVGECKPGQLVCVDGTENCEGAIGPNDEICDCKDNDCDGSIDEDTGSNSLCGEGERCAGCKCVPFCEPVQEFGLTCEVGLAPDVQPNGECLCVEDNCDSATCATSEQKSNDKVSCGPDNPEVGSCICRAGTCTPRCAGVSCDPGEICSPRTGNCIENNCRGLGCDDGERCNPSSGECVADPCADADCADGEVCRAGTCEKSCANVRCEGGRTCKAGSCVVNECSGVSCPGGEACNPDTGACVTDPCAQKQCEKGQICSVASGECESNPCWNVTCPDNQTCSREGECVAMNQGSAGSAGSGSGGAGGTTSRGSGKDSPFFAAGGGGGCSCSVPGPAEGQPRPIALPLLLAGALLALRARRRLGKHLPRMAASASGHAPVAGLGLILLLAAFLLGGCKVSPICLSCGEDSGAAGNATESGSGGTGGSGGSGGSEDDSGINQLDASDDSGPDSSVPLNDAGRPQCEPEGPEICDNKDQDCDLRVDEQVAPALNDCLQRGVCAGSAPVCAGGKFSCRYNNEFEASETLCDGKDNDCDGQVDETFNELGSACEVGVGACKVAGTRQCNTAGTGLLCVIPGPKDPGAELCNGQDDDCDGMIDEPKSEPGSNPSYVIDEVVQVKSNLWIYKHEASRSDANFNAPGIVSRRACSRGGALPWTNVTYDEASEACAAADMELCAEADWISACKGQSGSCRWAYTPTAGGCNSYATASPNPCNGGGDTGTLEATNESPLCYADFGGAGKVYDLSGNAKEWTRGASSPGSNSLRGGSYNQDDAALECDFDWSKAAPTLRLPNVGFRCCTSTAP